MKKLLLSFLLVAVCGVCQAQEKCKANCMAHSQNSEMEYIYCEQGFTVKKGELMLGQTPFYYAGLYSRDGKTLFKAYSQLNSYQCVAPGTEVIDARAFSDMGENMPSLLMIPATVKKIGFSTMRCTEVRVYEEDDITHDMPTK